MFHFFSLFTLACLSLVSTQSTCMDAPITIREITAISKPGFAAFLQNNNTATITGRTCSVVDLAHDVSIIGIPLEKPNRVIINDKKNLIAAANHDTCVLYDTETYSTKWQHTIEIMDRLAFTPDDTLWVLTKKGMLFNSIGKTYQIPHAVYTDINICSHPRKQQLFYTKPEENLAKSILYALKIKNDIPTIEPMLIPPRLISNFFDNSAMLSLHAPTENIVALYYPIDGNWSLYNYTEDRIINDAAFVECNNLAFHPNKAIVAMVMKNKLLRLYNFKTNTLLAEINLPNPPFPSTTAINQRTMDFSIDGNRLIFMLADKCFVADINPAVLD